MKKILVSISFAVLTAVTTFAQTSIDSPIWTMEVLFNPLSTASDGIELPAYGIKGRLFLTTAWSIRLQLGFDFNSQKSINYIDNQTDVWNKTIENTTTFTLFPGFEYHFAGNDRLSPYMGAEIGFGVYNNFNKTSNSENDNTATSKGTNYLFSVSALAGMDIFLYQGLYMGVEVSLGFNNLRENNNTTRIRISNTISDEKPKDHTIHNSLAFNCVPAIRLGWSF